MIDNYVSLSQTPECKYYKPSINLPTCSLFELPVIWKCLYHTQKCKDFFRGTCRHAYEVIWGLITAPGTLKYNDNLSTEKRSHLSISRILLTEQYYFNNPFHKLTSYLNVPYNFMLGELTLVCKINVSYPKSEKIYAFTFIPYKIIIIEFNLNRLYFRLTRVSTITDLNRLYFKIIRFTSLYRNIIYLQYPWQNKSENHNDNDENFCLFSVLSAMISHRQKNLDKPNTRGLAYIFSYFIINCNAWHSSISITSYKVCIIFCNLLKAKYCCYSLSTNNDEHKSNKTRNIFLYSYNDHYISQNSDLTTCLFIVFLCLIDVTVDDHLREVWIVVDDETVAKPIHKVDARAPFDFQLDRHTLDKRNLGEQDEVHGGVPGSSEPWKNEVYYEDTAADGQDEQHYKYYHIFCVTFLLPSFFEYDKVSTHEGCPLYVTPDFADLGYSVPFFESTEGPAICSGPNTSVIHHYWTYNKIYKLYTLILNKGFKSYHRVIMINLSLDQRHVGCLLKNKLRNDIEPNPGPNRLNVITLNCRGLGNIDKFRLILNRCYDITSKTTAIIMLQETMITDDNYLKLAWRGKYVFTSGTKNSKGCITLMNNEMKIEHIHHLGNRGHYFTATGLDGDRPTIIMNLYAPNGFGIDKFDFFVEAFDIIAAYDCDVLIAGDLNVTLRPSDRFNRGVTQAEERLAAVLLDYLEDLNLCDEWSFAKKSGSYTWKRGDRGDTMSRLDRVFSRLTGFKHKAITTDWTFTTTDHAAVTVEYVAINKKVYRNEHIKLDDAVVKNASTLQELRTYLYEQLTYAGNMNPHMLLEYTKMTIRTKALDIMARSRRAMVSELNNINDDINTNVALLSRYTDVNSQLILHHEIENATLRKNVILQEQGEKLALRAKTRWYNEGEKSNKYFLNLLKRQNEEMKW